ncbi:hypothetical protein SL003B_1839 [Polymorphum gilvum SL003B-26A1]|uniref:Uncharacterized protein n=1 Tax=Polymorphum gilvum (strain LMG 25793 / CGMCC 1.9160 / SL003B-26A1) TaxID=991905 RepID=F2IVY3_POLGS|nr:hypothetical protein SL003B_1839 [Polymorphum gilvum SL003B-26A1]
MVEQIAALPRTDRPLLVCDVDEVVFHMASHFETYLAERGFAFLSHSYHLTGNIAAIGETAPLGRDEVRRLIHGFFDAESGRQTVVQGASAALARLSRDWQVVFLTNLPGAHNKPARERLLADHGMPYPVVTNSGPKGGAVSALAAGARGPLVFIDDSPLNLRSVAAALPAATLVQFIADARFRAMAEPLAEVALVTGDWDQTAAFIEAILLPG